jgi:hypothetical protein
MSPRILNTVLLLVLTLLALVGLAALARDAHAGSYHVYTCRTPTGEPAPADGWSGSKTGTYTYAQDTCQQPGGGALIAALGDQPARTANTDVATWAFGAPAGERISAATLWRAGDADGGAAVNATYEFWLAGPENRNNPTNVFDQCVGGSTCPAGAGNTERPTANENRVTVPTRNLGSGLFINASCSGVNEFKCPEAKGDTQNYAAVVYLYAADITLEQTAGPSASGAGGELATASTVSGTSDLTFNASDPGSGVYEAVFSVDGQVVQRTVLGENGGRCRDVGQASDGLPAFLYIQPCLTSVSADVGFDTTRISDGTHHIVVSVVDAAGNSAPVIDRNISVANIRSGQTGTSSASGITSGSSGAGGQALGALNGTNAAAQTTLTVSWQATKSMHLMSRYGRPQTIVGRLLGPGGVPIAGASIDLTATPADQGARAATMASPRTGADGRFTVRLPGGVSSRTLRFAYREHLGDPQPVATRTLTLSVDAAILLSITPRTASVGRSIFFHGRMLGGSIPKGGKQLVLEARSPRGAWLEFKVIRADTRGRYRASYRFRLRGPTRYQFRVLSEAESDYPFATGSSRVVDVSER